MLINRDLSLILMSVLLALVFRIDVRCTGKAEGDVEFRIQINVSIFSTRNITTLNLRRTKACYSKCGHQIISDTTVSGHNIISDDDIRVSGHQIISDDDITVSGHLIISDDVTLRGI